MEGQCLKVCVCDVTLEIPMPQGDGGEGKEGYRDARDWPAFFGALADFLGKVIPLILAAFQAQRPDQGDKDKLASGGELPRVTQHGHAARK